MTDTREIARTITECERIWQRSGISNADIADMRLQLTQHLEAAAVDGRDPEDVTGTNLERFATHWAAEAGAVGDERVEATVNASLDRLRRRRGAMIGYWIGTAALIGGVAAGTLLRGGDNSVDAQTWAWVWTVIAVVMGIAEIFTAGFFLLPFAVGAAAAAILGWIGTPLIAQWLVFFGVTTISFIYMRRYAQLQAMEPQPKVGANRWTDARGIVLQDIDPDTSSGMVRIENEEWRATTADNRALAAGTKVVVREVRGSRLVVESIESN